MTKDFRNLEKKTITILIALTFALSGATFAHSGNTDAKGCHTEHSTNHHHCHEELVLTTKKPEITEKLSEMTQDSSVTIVVAQVTEESPSTTVEESSTKTVSEEVITATTETVKVSEEVIATTTETAKSSELTEEPEEIISSKVTKETGCSPNMENEVTKETTPITEEVTTESSSKVTEETASLSKRVAEVASTPEIRVKSSSETNEEPMATNTTAKLTYEDGIQAGIRQCQNNPVSCGIMVNTYAKVPSPWRAPGYMYHPPRAWYPPFPPPRRY
jgi:hypothetical protein